MSLSPFDETSIYGKHMTLIHAQGEKLTLRDPQGNLSEYVDLMSAYGSVNFGHCNKKITPFDQYPADLAACFYPPEAKEYSEWLIRKLNVPNHEVLFQVGGSAAVSAAISIAQRVRKGKIAYLKGSFHGLGLDALSITSTHKTFALQDTELLRAFSPYCVELPVHEQVTDIEWANISCFIFEPIQGANGYVPIDPTWLKAVISEAREHEVIIIADEIQSGFYRHGQLSVAQDRSLEPDMLLFSKSMTNGMFPFSAIVYPSIFRQVITEELFLAHTFQTSALGCYASMSVANYVDAHDIGAVCQQVEKLLTKFSYQLLEYDNVRNLYVTGPTLSFELVGMPGKRLVQACMDRGILLFTGGPHGERLRIAPPVTIDLSVLRSSLECVLQTLHSLMTTEAQV